MLGATPALMLWSAASAEEIHQIPLVDGLSVMSASGEAADDSGEVREITVSRIIRREDWRNSRIMRRRFEESDPSQFPGTTPELSALAVNEVRALGRTTVTYIEI